MRLYKDSFNPLSAAYKEGVPESDMLTLEEYEYALNNYMTDDELNESTSFLNIVFDLCYFNIYDRKYLPLLIKHPKVLQNIELGLKHHLSDIYWLECLNPYPFFQMGEALADAINNHGIEINDLGLLTLGFVDYNKLNPKISLNENLRQHKDILLIDAVLSNYHKYFKNMNPFKIIAGIQKILLAPESLDQSDVSLCGPIAALTWLIKNNPQQVKQLFVDLLIHGKGQSDIKAKAIKKPLDYANVEQFIIASMKNALNRVGYAPNSMVELLTGITGPEDECKMLIQMGGDVAVEDAKLQTAWKFEVFPRLEKY